MIIYNPSPDHDENGIQNITLDLSTTLYGSHNISCVFKNNPAANTIRSLLLNQCQAVDSHMFAAQTQLIVSKYKNESIESCKKNCQDFILFLWQHIAIDDSCKELLLQDVNFPVLRNDINTDIIKTAETDILAATKKASIATKELENLDAIWVLAEYLKFKHHFQEAADLFQTITKDNPHYRQAQLSLRDIICNLLSSHKNGAETIVMLSRELAMPKYQNCKIREKTCETINDYSIVFQ